MTDPDCRPKFLSAMQGAIQAGLASPVRVHAPLLHLTKETIIRLGLELNAPLHLTWSCYSGGSVPCGICDSCKIRATGFERVGIPDPALE